MNNDFPKIIHQLWIGKKKKPNIFLDEWKIYVKNNKDWEYKFWEEKEIEKIDFKCKHFFEYEISKNDYPAASDHIRYEILYKYGGLWCDADSVPMNNKSMNFFIDNLDKNQDAFFFYEPLTQWQGKKLIGNSIIGSKKNSKILKIITDYFSNISLEEYKKNQNPNWIKTGPVAVTNLIRDNNLEFNSCKIYDSKYAFPVQFHGITDIKYHKKYSFPESYIFNYGYSTSGLHNYVGGRYINHFEVTSLLSKIIEKKKIL